MKIVTCSRFAATILRTLVKQHTSLNAYKQYAIISSTLEFSLQQLKRPMFVQNDDASCGGQMDHFP